MCFLSGLIKMIVHRVATKAMTTRIENICWSMILYFKPIEIMTKSTAPLQFIVNPTRSDFAGGTFWTKAARPEPNAFPK